MNYIYTTSIGQSAHQDVVKQSGLRRILFDKSCLRRIFCYKTSDLRRMILIKNLLLKHSGMHLIWSSLFCLPIHWWWTWFKRSVYEKRFWWHNLGHSARPWQQTANNLDKIESSPKVCMCGVPTQQWQSTQIILFERTRQSAWLDAVTRSEWILVY